MTGLHNKLSQTLHLKRISNEMIEKSLQKMPKPSEAIEILKDLMKIH